MQRIRHYLDPSDHDHFAEQRDQVHDTRARITVNRCVMRPELGNFGDHKPLREDVWELRMDVGVDYHIYYAKAGATVVLLLYGGDERKQGADIDRACAYWRD